MSVFQRKEKYDKRTLLPSGMIIDKDSPILEAIGAIEETIAILRDIKSIDADPDLNLTLSGACRKLSRLVDQIGAGAVTLLSRQDCEWMDGVVQRAPLETVKPSRKPLLASRALLAKAVCGRAERRLLSLLNMSTTGFGLSDYPAETLKWDEGLVFLTGLSAWLAFIAAANDFQD
jgi:cob(I)alamin adenosyltransferase